MSGEEEDSAVVAVAVTVATVRVATDAVTLVRARRVVRRASLLLSCKFLLAPLAVLSRALRFVY